MKEGVAELVNRISYLKEANVRLEAQLKAVTDEIANAKARHDSYGQLLGKLREEKNTDSANWAFRVLQDFHLKADAAQAVEQLLADAVRATTIAESERQMLDFIIGNLPDTLPADGETVDPGEYLDEGGDRTKAWRAAIAAHLRRRQASGHQDPH